MSDDLRFPVPAHSPNNALEGCCARASRQSREVAITRNANKRAGRGGKSPNFGQRGTEWARECDMRGRGRERERERGQWRFEISRFHSAPPLKQKFTFLARKGETKEGRKEDEEGERIFFVDLGSAEGEEKNPRRPRTRSRSPLSSPPARARPASINGRRFFSLWAESRFCNAFTRYLSLLLPPFHFNEQ